MLEAQNPTQILLLLMGGTALLLYGVKQITDAVEGALGARMRLVMMIVANNPLAAFGSGVAVTLLTQSSTATASIMVGLVSAQLVPLAAAVIMLLGAAVGSTLIVPLLILKMTDHALVLLGLGAAVALATRRTRLRDLGRVLFSFGLILLGLAMIGVSSAPIAGSAIMSAIMRTIAQSPLVLVLLGVLLSGIFVSSIAAVGIILVLVASGAVPIAAALAVMLGANLGTTITPLLTALTQESVSGRRLGVIYFSTRLVGVVAFLVVLNPVAGSMTKLFPDPPTLVAAAHFGFNMLLAILFVPLANLIANFVTRLLPDTAADSGLTPCHLDPGALTLPAFALGQATRETLRMADLAVAMLELSIQAFSEGVKELPKRLGQLDNQLDNLEEAIKQYLIQINDDLLTEAQSQRELALLQVSTELEAIGDVVDRQLMRLARRKRRKQIAFSQAEWSDIENYHRDVLALLQQALAGFATQDPSIAEDVLSQRQWLNQTKRDIYLRHLQRLSSGTAVNLNASAIHLEVLTAMSRILSHTCNIARVVVANEG
ncbi:MAG TPA: Na/Pi cotransporter family protein [Stenomitos sp.]